MGPCTAVMDNSVALKEVGMARQLQAIGQDLANPMEVKLSFLCMKIYEAF